MKKTVGALAQTTRRQRSMFAKAGRHYSIGVPVGTLVGLLSLILLFCVTTAQAAVLVEPESTVVVARSSDQITDFSATKGKVSVLTDADNRNVLLFIAPSDIPNEDVVVTYKVNGVEKTATYTVQSGATTFGSDEVYSASFKALFLLFILAVVVESGLQLIFRWRPYLQTFNTAGSNALIAFAFSFFFVSYFKLDIATRLVNAYLGAQSGFEDTVVGYILTAMIVAGGSAGVNQVFRAFGIRPIGPPAELAGPVHDDTAWISVAVKREKADGTIDILYGEQGKEAVIGTISGSLSNNPLRNMFLRNRGRFPQSGGYSVAVTDKPQVITVIAKDSTGKNIPVPPWGPHPIGPRAIIDVERTA